MYRLFSNIPLLSTTERQANMNTYFFNRFISYNPYRKNISYNKNKPNKMKKKMKKNKYKNIKYNLDIDRNKNKNINDTNFTTANKLNIIYSLYKKFKF